MTSRRVLLPLLCLLALGPLPNLGCGRDRERPNILLITLDTTRRDHLSCYGYGRKTSPHLDALADEGTCYRNALAMSSWTLPSHASLFTGLFPTTHRAHYDENAEVSLEAALDTLADSHLYRVNGLSAGAETLAETLREAGYVTGGVGGGPWLKPCFGLSQGFDYYDCEVSSISGRPAHEVNALAVPFIEQNADRPFFLFLNYFDAHFPYMPPPQHRRRFFEKGWGGGESGEKNLQILKTIALYDAEIFYADEMMGALFRELKRLDIYDDTLIVVTSDHGEQFGRRGIIGHGQSLFEADLRIPLVVKPPAAWDRMGSPDARVQLVSLMPTILERLGLRPAAPMDAGPIGAVRGAAVAELYKNPAKVQADAGGEGGRFDRDLKAVYAGDYKLIVSTRANDRDAGLFDLASDPKETRSLLAARPDLADSMEAALRRWGSSLSPPLDPMRIDEVDPETARQLKALGY
jgi:arylsulfatase A-like enzyme